MQDETIGTPGPAPAPEPTVADAVSETKEAIATTGGRRVEAGASGGEEGEDRGQEDDAKKAARRRAAAEEGGARKAQEGRGEEGRARRPKKAAKKVAKKARRRPRRRAGQEGRKKRSASRRAPGRFRTRGRPAGALFAFLASLPAPGEDGGLEPVAAAREPAQHVGQLVERRLGRDERLRVDLRRPRSGGAPCGCSPACGGTST